MFKIREFFFYFFLVKYTIFQLKDAIYVNLGETNNNTTVFLKRKKRIRFFYEKIRAQIVSIRT